MRYLRSRLAARYGKGHKRPIFQHIIPELLKEYPVVLRHDLLLAVEFPGGDAVRLRDHGRSLAGIIRNRALALMCARNAVIVGDSMQLPNVHHGCRPAPHAGHRRQTRN